MTVLDPVDDDVFVETLAPVIDRPSPVAAAGGRSVRVLRATAETRLSVRLSLDGASRVRVETGAGLYDHFLEQLAFHASFDLVLEGAGDLETGDHHTSEDAAIALGQALDQALGDRRGIARYGDAVVPMDDALHGPRSISVDARTSSCNSSTTPGWPATCCRASRSRRGLRSTSSVGRDAHHVGRRRSRRGPSLDGRRPRQGLPSTKGLL